MGMIRSHQAKIQSAIRSIVIAVSSISMTLGWVGEGQANQIQSSLDILLSPEVYGAVAVIGAAIWGILDPNKQIGRGDS